MTAMKTTCQEENQRCSSYIIEVTSRVGHVSEIQNIGHCSNELTTAVQQFYQLKGDVDLKKDDGDEGDSDVGYGNVDVKNVDVGGDFDGDNCDDGKVDVLSDDEFSDESADTDDGLPIDTGWAWIVLAGAFLNITLMTGYIRGMSILFVEYLKMFNAATAKTTLLMGVYAGVNSLFSLLSMHIVVSRLGIRKTLFLGATISVLGMASATFPTSIDFLIGVHSTVLGIGNSMILGPGILSIGQYFKQRRGFASAFALSGVCLGGSIFPPLITFLLDQYGIRGTMIIITGLTMNMFVGAAVNMPIEMFRKQRKRRTNTKSLDDERCALKSQKKNFPVPKSSKQVVTGSIQYDSRLSADSDSLKREQTDTKESLHHSSRSIEVIASSPEFGSVMSSENGDMQDNFKKQDVSNSNERNGCHSALDFTLFRNPIFILIIAYTFFTVPISLSISYLPALAAENGIDQKDAAIFLAILGTLDFFCRLIAGIIVDSGYIRVNIFMAVGLFVLGSASQFSFLLNTYNTLLIFSVITGVFACTYFAVFSVAIVEFLGLEYLGKTLGFVSLFQGIALAIANPLVGGIRDLTGSYNGGYCYIGASAFIAAILLVCQPLVKRYALKPQDF